MSVVATVHRWDYVFGWILGWDLGTVYWRNEEYMVEDITTSTPFHGYHPLKIIKPFKPLNSPLPPHITLIQNLARLPRTCVADIPAKSGALNSRIMPGNTLMTPSYPSFLKYSNSSPPLL
jgi:hypothetical protein